MTTPGRGIDRRFDQSRPGESLAQVMGRLADAAAEAETLRARGDVPHDLGALSDLSVAIASSNGEVEVEVIETQIADLQLDSSWLRSASAGHVAALITETINTALTESQDRAVSHMLGPDAMDGALSTRIAQLQIDMHHAFEHELARVLQPADETLRRHQEYSDDD